MPLSSETGAIEIRSYRNVFDLERRIYRIDQFKLNPTGVPVRGVLSFLACVTCMLLSAHMPLLGTALGLVPWYLRDVLAPGFLAAIFTMVQIDGRPLRRHARALLRDTVDAHAGTSLTLSPPRRWCMRELLLLVDGSDSRLRRVRYRGPGAVTVGVGHSCVTGRRGTVIPGRRRTRVALLEAPDGSRVRARQVIVLRRGTSLEVGG